MTWAKDSTLSLPRQTLLRQALKAPVWRKRHRQKSQIESHSTKRPVRVRAGTAVGRQKVRFLPGPILRVVGIAYIFAGVTGTGTAPGYFQLRIINTASWLVLPRYARRPATTHGEQESHPQETNNPSHNHHRKNGIRPPGLPWGLHPDLKPALAPAVD